VRGFLVFDRRYRRLSRKIYIKPNCQDDETGLARFGRLLVASVIIIIIYLLQLGLHPVAVVLTLHNYNKKHTLTTTKNIQYILGSIDFLRKSCPLEMQATKALAVCLVQFIVFDIMALKQILCFFFYDVGTLPVSTFFMHNSLFCDEAFRI
jgi:hypothetical protein